MPERGDSRRIDVLHLSWSGRVGGIERMLEVLLHEARERRGLRHAAGFLDGAGPIGEALEREGLAWRLGMRHGADPRGLWRLRRRLRRERPRLLHLHTVALGATAVALRAVAGPVVYTEHFPRLLDAPHRLVRLYRLLRRRGARAIALSSGLARRMSALGLPADHIAVVPNPCGLAAMDAAPRNGQPPVIGCLTRLVPPACVELAIETAARLRGNGTPCRLLVVGDGPVREPLARLAGEQLGPDGATFAGEQAEVGPWLDRMDVLLFTREAAIYPLALVEAMARRVPVVALRCEGGAAEIVEAAGVLLADRDPATAAATIVRLLAEPEARDRIVERGRRLAAEHAPANVLDRLEAVYAAAGIGAESIA